MVSMNDRVRMLRPYPFHPNKDQVLKPEYIRWFDTENKLRPRPLDLSELIRALVKTGLPIKEAKKKAAESQAKNGDKEVWIACGTDPLVEQIIAAMQAEIEKHGLELMSRYPHDLLVADRNFLMMRVAPGARFAWTVSDSSSHITMLGVDKESNEKVGYVLNNSSSQRFYQLVIGRGSFQLQEISRDSFAKLEHTKIDYSLGGKPAIGCNVIYKQGNKIGTIVVRREGSYCDGDWFLDFHPESGVGVDCLAALRAYGEFLLKECAGTLFVSASEVWHERTSQMLRAA